jgi:hypothetical protein
MRTKIILACKFIKRYYRAEMRKEKRNALASRPNLTARPGGYARWLRNFEECPGVEPILAKLVRGGVDVERARTLLYAAPLLGNINYRHGLKELDQRLAAAQLHLQDAANLLEPFPFPPQHKVRLLGLLETVRAQVEQQRRLYTEWRPAFTTIQQTNWVITWLGKELSGAGIRTVNESIATLLSAADVPGGDRDELAFGWVWSAQTVKKRRARFRANPLMTLFFPALFSEQVDIEKLAHRFPTMFFTNSQASQLRQGLPDVTGDLVPPRRNGTRTIGQRIAATKL